MIATLVLPPTVVRAEDHAAPAKQDAHAAPAEGEAPPRIDILDLGRFRIRSTRTTDRQVIDVKFSLQLVLSTATTAADHEELVHWRNRFRDQAIIAVRTADSSDFGDPSLRRVQRLVLHRVKRLPVAAQIIGVYLSDFALDEGESIAEQYVPTIIPSAAPEKKPAKSGGH